MTEVSSDPTDKIALRVNSTILYDASPRLANTLGEVFYDEQREAIERKGLKLASRALKFATDQALLEFTDRSVNPRIRHNADLSRLDMSSRVSWETVKVKNTELSRIYIAPRPIQEVALRGLYADYARSQFEPIEDTALQRMRSGALALTVLSEDLALGREDGLTLLRERLDDPALRSGMYAENPRVSTSFR